MMKKTSRGARAEVMDSSKPLLYSPPSCSPANKCFLFMVVEYMSTWLEMIVKASDLVGSFIGHEEEIRLVGGAGRCLERQLSPGFLFIIFTIFAFWYF